MHVNEVPECAILPVRRKVYFAFNGELNPLVNKFCSSVDSDIVIQARNGESELQLETTLKVKYPYRALQGQRLYWK